MSYRPIPEGLLFLGLGALSPWTRNAGHVVNLALIAASVILLVRLVTRLSSPRAGLLSGLLFACVASLPTVVAWTSCAPEAFAIFFVLLALNLRHSGRTWGAFAAAGAALLSKETALLLVPVLVLWDRLLGRKPDRTWSQLILYGCLAGIWAWIHPGFRSLWAHGFQSGGTGYLGLEEPGRWPSYLGRYVAAALNLPVTGLTTRWPGDVMPFGVAALFAVLAWLWTTRAARVQRPTPGLLPLPRAAVLALLIAVPLLVLPSILVRRWNPYFVCLPAVGIALLGGILLARASTWIVAVVLAAVLMLGIWSRGIEVPGGLVFTERDCVAASHAIQRVEGGFVRSRPSFAPGSQALVSVAGTGLLGIHGTLLDGQSLRIWYGDRTLTTRLPERRQPGATADHLFRIGEDLDVTEIDADRHEPWGGPWLDDRRAIRSYARGLAASGETDRAVAILKRISETDPGRLRDYDLRLAAMALLGAGRRDEALSLLESATPFSRPLALDAIAKLFGEGTGNAALDSSAFEAFGIAREEEEAKRYVRAKVGR